MLAIERKNEILAILQKEQRVLVSELSRRYEVTDETIRRDLEKLEKEGFVKRTYGGAVLNKRKDLDMPLRIREKTNRGEKQIIAGLVKDLIEEGDRIMLDASSTSLMISKELKEMEKLTVITNSVEVLIELAGHDGIQVISTGGNLNETSLSLVGNAAQKVLNGYHVDKAVFSCKGIDMKDGITYQERHVRLRGYGDSGCGQQQVRPRVLCQIHASEKGRYSGDGPEAVGGLAELPAGAGRAAGDAVTEKERKPKGLQVPLIPSAERGKSPEISCKGKDEYGRDVLQSGV